MKRSKLLPYLLLTLTVLFWSGNFIIGRGIKELIPPISLNFWRWFGAMLILLPFGLPRILRQRALFLSHWKMLVMISIPSICFYNLFIYTALQSTTAVNTVLVNAITPVFIFMAALIFFNERMGFRQAVGVLVSFIGLIFIITRGDVSVLKSLAFSRADLWTLGAALSWTVYSVMLTLRPKEMDPVAFLTAVVVLGIILSLPFYLWELFTKGGFALSASSLGSILYVCLFPSVLAYIFWNRGVEEVGAGRAGIFIHLHPVFTILLAFLFLGETLRQFHIYGILLIFTGIAMTTIPSRDGSPKSYIGRSKFG